MCECISVVNDKLRERNTRLVIPFILRFKGEDPSPTRLLIEVEQIETGRGKSKAVSMFASYCPFCGEHYGEPTAADDVKAERARQIAQEGYSPERDDGYTECDLARAAACYALAGGDEVYQVMASNAIVWPWGMVAWKPTTYRQNLVKAGALVIAEIERLDRREAM